MTEGIWWPARGLRPLTGDDYHSLRLWLIFIRHECCTKNYVEYPPCSANIGLSWRWGRLLIGCSSLHLFIFALGIRWGWEVCPVKCCQNLEYRKNEYSYDHTRMFKIKVFPTIFLKKIHCQGKVYYGNENFKAVAVLLDLEPSGTSMEEISQKSAPIAKSIKNSHARPDRMP